jgi:hypothetical protein
MDRDNRQVRGLVAIVGVVASACSYTPRTIDEISDASQPEPDGELVFPDARPDAMPGAPDAVPDAMPLLCPPGYNNSLDGHRYRAGTGSWYDGEMSCEAEGTHLVVIDSLLEAGLVDIMTQGQVWIGMSDHRDEGVFKWVTDGSLVLIGWRSGEPNDGNGDEDCGTFAPGLDFGFNDGDCETNLAYVCECDAEVMPTNPYWCETDIDTACEDCTDDCTDDEDQCNNHECG